MKYFIILFICLICSLWIVNYEDTSDVLDSYEESVYVFREYTENDENVSNPEMDDLELKANIVIIFYSILFSLMFYIKMNNCDRYVIYNR
ncbi:MAG: hypothetical protein E7171_03080 [Firmicutes bacterium]|nr:hypothetical protein [Bacillota bacterium]